MKTDQIIAELFSLLRLLLTRHESTTALEARVAALEAWRGAIDGIWPPKTPEQEIK